MTSESAARFFRGALDFDCLDRSSELSTPHPKPSANIEVVVSERILRVGKTERAGLREFAFLIFLGSSLGSGRGSVSALRRVKGVPGIGPIES